MEKWREITLFGKNLKPTRTFKNAHFLPNLSGPNQELQFDFAGPILDDQGNKTFLLVTFDRFSIILSVLVMKTTGAKTVVKFLDSYIRNHGLPQSIRTDQRSGFKNDMVKQFFSSRGIINILPPAGDHRGSCLVERSIQTIKRKLGTAKLDPNFVSLKSTIQQIIEEIRKSKRAVLKKSPFELHFGREPNSEWSQAYRNFVNNASSAQGLERNLLTPHQIAIRDYGRDRAKLVLRGSTSPFINPRFRPITSKLEKLLLNDPKRVL